MRQHLDCDSEGAATYVRVTIAVANASHKPLLGSCSALRAGKHSDRLSVETGRVQFDDL